MAGDLNIKAEIEYVLKDQGITAAVKKIDDLEKSLKKTQASAKSATTSFAEFGKTLGQYLGAAVILQFTRTAVTEFAAVERSLNSLQREMQSLGKGAEFDRVKDFLTGIEDSGDALLTQTVPAFRQFLGITQDVAKALDLVTMANTLADKGIGEFGQNVALIAGIFTGRSAPAAKAFGLALSEINDYGKDGGVVMQQLADKVNLLAGGTEDAQDSVDKLGGLWQQFKRTAGELASSALPALLVPLKGIAAILIGIVNFTGATITALKALGQSAATALDIKTLVTSPTQYFEAVKASYAEYGRVGAQAFTDAWDATLKQWDSIFNGQAGGGKVSGKGFNVMPEPAEVKKDAEKAADAWTEVWLKAHRNLAELSEQGAEERAKREAEISEQYRERLLENWQEGKQLELDTNEQLLQIAIDTAREELEARKANLEERLQFEKSVIDRTVQNEKVANALKLKLDKEYAREKAALEKTSMEMERAYALGAVEDTLTAMSAAFEGRKGFAIALAIMNTYRAVTAILGDESMPTWAKPAAIAAALALGWQQVQRIRSTNIGGGGGGGGGGGARFSRNVGSGSTSDKASSQSMSSKAQQSSSSVTYDNSGKTEVHFHAPVVGGKEGARELVRIVERAGRQDRARKLR